MQSADSAAASAIRPIIERIDPDELFHGNWDDHDRDAVSLLLFSGALRPALLAPSTGAASLLRRLSFSEDLAPVYRLATSVADHADRLQGVRLDASLFRATLSGTWEEEYQSFVARARAWLERAASKRNLFRPADRVWRDLLESGCLAELTAIMTGDQDVDRTRVDTICEQIADKKAFNDLVRRTDRKGNRSDAIEGRALKQIWNDVQPAVRLGSEWLRLMDAKPNPSGFVGQRVDALRKDLDRYGRKAIAALDTARTDDTTGARGAAVKHARNAINGFLELFDSPASVPDDLNPNVIQSRDLLFVTDLDLDAKFQPVQNDKVDLLSLLLNTTAHADTARAAFDARLSRKDLIGARLALDFVDAEDDQNADDCRASLLQTIEGHRRELRTALAKAEAHVERAFCRGQIDADERTDMTAELAESRAVAVTALSTLPSLDEVANLSTAFPTLVDIDGRVEQSREENVRRATNRLRELPADRLDNDGKLIVEKTISEGDILTAYEQISRLESGEIVTPPRSPEDPFQEFMQRVGDIEREREANDITGSTIARRAGRREPCAGIPFDTLSDAAAKQAAAMLEAWYSLAKKGRVDKSALHQLLQSLGFKVRDMTVHRPGRGWPRVEVSTEPIEDRIFCPSRQFRFRSGRPLSRSTELGASR